MSWWRSRRVQAALSVLTVALVFGFLLPQLADYGAAWTSITRMSWLELVLIIALALWNLVSYVPLLISVLPGLTVREAAVSNFASTAISNTLPGGGALGVGVTVTIQRSFGHPAADVALGAIVSGIWNSFVRLGLPVLALGLVVITGDVPSGLLAAAVAGVAVLVVMIGGFALLLRSPALARRVGAAAERVVAAPLRLLKRAPRTGWADGAARFRTRTIGLIAGRARRITVATLLNHVSLYLVLLVCLRAVGVPEHAVGWIEVLAAYSIVRLLSAIPLTPGGLGIVELGLTASLGHGLPGTLADRVAAAVLLYRALTWFTPIPLGVAAWAYWRSSAVRRDRRRARRARTPALG